jgi:hypothetical protein
MRIPAILPVLCLAACGAPGTQVEPVAPLEVEPIEAPAPAPPIPPGEPVEAAAPPAVDQAVKQRIEELFGLCKSGSFEEAAGYVVYRGDDPSLKWKTVCDYSTEEGQKAVHGACNRINAYLSAADSWEFEEFEMEQESEGDWLVWEVAFVKGSERKLVYFAFLEVEGVHALGDID